MMRHSSIKLGKCLARMLHRDYAWVRNVTRNSGCLYVQSKLKSLVMNYASIGKQGFFRCLTSDDACIKQSCGVAQKKVHAGTKLSTSLGRAESCCSFSSIKDKYCCSDFVSGLSQLSSDSVRQGRERYQLIDGNDFKRPDFLDESENNGRVVVNLGRRIETSTYIADYRSDVGQPKFDAHSVHLCPGAIFCLAAPAFRGGKPDSAHESTYGSDCAYPIRPNRNVHATPWNAFVARQSSSGGYNHDHPLIVPSHSAPNVSWRNRNTASIGGGK